MDPQRKHGILCYNSDGSLRWQFVPGAEVTWKGFEYVNTYRIQQFSSSGPNGKRFVVVIANQTPYYPSQVSILDSDGKWIGEYWNTGYVFQL